MKSSTSHNYRADIDGLRAVAILLVVAYHAFPAQVRGGFIGVDVFLVISGFLISSNIFKGLEERSFSLVDFYARRCRRIIPALVVVLASVTLLSYAVSPGLSFTRLGRHLVAGATFTSNLLLLRESGYFDAASELKPFLHLWSLGIEEQFYLFWPALALIASRVRLKLPLFVLALFAVSFAVNLRWAAQHPAKDFYLLPSRFWELLAGCALALPSARSRRFADLKALVGLAMLVAAALLLDRKAHFPGWWATLPTGAACLFISAGPDAAFNRKILSHRLMVFVGVISYPLYLWHWPLLSILRDTRGAEAGVGARLGVVALSVLLAILTWRLVEKPIQRHFSFRGSGFEKSPAFAICSSLAALGMLAILGMLIQRDVLISRDQKNNPIAYQLQKYAVYDNTPTRINHCFVDTAIAFTGFAEDCYVGDPHKQNVMLLGDSHAAHLYPGLVESLRGSNVELLQMNASNCPPLVGGTASDLESCHEANELVFRTVRAVRPQLVILDAEWTSYFARPHIHAALEQTIRQLRDDGVERVIVIGPVPDWFSSLHQVLETKFLRAGAGLPSHTNVGLDPSALGVNEVLRRDATEAGALYISLTDRLCDAAGCVTFVGPDVSSDLIVYDTDHLTVAGARFVSRTIVAPALTALFHR